MTATPTPTPPPRAHRVTVTPKPDGVELGIRGYTRDLLTDVVTLLAEQPELMDDLDRAITATPADPYQPERHLPTEHLVEAILAALPASATGIRLHGPAAEQLANSLSAATTGQGRPKAVKAA